MLSVKPSLLKRYEVLRRQEHERLSGLLDTLGKMDGLPAEQMDQARDALFHADHPYLIALVGAFNTGKSSIVNALVGEPVLEVGATPTTSKIAILRYGPAMQRSLAGEVETVFYPASMLEQVSLVDTPGLESIFKAHDEVTRKFLHRADMVLFVMLATQAMSATNIEYLQALRTYGKRVIIAINQVDAIEPEERETIKTFVTDQAKATLGFVPQVWMISARMAMQAQDSKPRDEALWKTSGFDQIERFINDALNDSVRVKQKLETPIQIARNVTTVARSLIREQQNALSDYRRSAENVHKQIDIAEREQQMTVRETVKEVSRTFAEAIQRGREAIHDIFQFSRIFQMAIGSVIELLGLARLIRRLGAGTPAKTAFEAHKVNEPLDELPAIMDRLGPRLEGRDVKDIDDLISYARREIEQLPGSLQNKIVGRLEAPASYDRALMRSTRESWQAIIEKARTTEFRRIDQAVRNWLIVMGAYEIIIIIAAVVSAVTMSGTANNNWFLFLMLLIALLFGGLLLLPLRGALMESAYRRRMLGIEAELEQSLEKTAEQQIVAGTRMRNDAVAPFMRLLEAQISQVDQTKTDLDNHEQGLVMLEKELGGLRE